MLGYYAYDDDDDDQIPRSPGLQPIRVRITPDKSPRAAEPTRAPPMTASASHRDLATRRGHAPRRRKRNTASQGDTVLWGTAYPNRPDLARELGSRPLFSGSEDDDDDSAARSDDAARSPAAHHRHAHPSASPDAPTRSSTTASLNPMLGALSAGPGLPAHGALSHQAYSPSDVADPLSRPGATFGKGKGRSDAPDTSKSEAQRRSSTWSSLSSSDRAPPDVSHGSKKRPSLTDKSPVKYIRESDSIAASPRLMQHILTGPQGSAGASYLTESPAPSRSATLAGPESMSLPPVKHLLEQVAHHESEAAHSKPRTASLSSAGLLDPVSRNSSSATTPSLSIAPYSLGPGQPLPPYSPYPSRGRTDSLSSGLHASRAQHSADQPRAFGHQPQGSGSSTHSGPSLVPPSLSSISTVSPSTTTPTIAQDASARTSPTEDDRAPASRLESAGQQTLYKCLFPGCHAPPFLTQYLLNSHKNVHSEERPYYCSVAGCARAEGGRGFKRRNEMLRHGLVHSSPGYVCPFCPDREHRYPRPDNLLRHVRMHHKDQDPDDARLREVLVQRRPGAPASSGRGRRKRASGDAADPAHPGLSSADAHQQPQRSGRAARGAGAARGGRGGRAGGGFEHSSGEDDDGPDG